MFVGNFGAQTQVIVDSGGGGAIEGDSAFGVVFLGADIQLILFDVRKVQVGQFGNANAGLDQEFDDGRNADIKADNVA